MRIDNLILLVDCVIVNKDLKKIYQRMYVKNVIDTMENVFKDVLLILLRMWRNNSVMILILFLLKVWDSFILVL